MAKRVPGQIHIWMLLAAACVFATAAVADPMWRQNGNSKAATEGGQCVRPTDWMRRNHMDLIQHDRDVTVHQGIRTVDGSLSECINCHVNQDDSGAPMPVNGPDQFCAGCHEYIGTTLDCFSCHSTVPRH
jgi:hypothetical protein